MSLPPVPYWLITLTYNDKAESPRIPGTLAYECWDGNGYAKIEDILDYQIAMRREDVDVSYKLVTYDNFSPMSV